MDQHNLIADITAYWDSHIHDLAIVTNPVGTPGFFRQLDEYRYDKLNYLPRLVDFDSYRGKTLLEIGCGAGVDLVRFARAGAIVTGVDLSRTAIDLARQNLGQQGLDASLQIMNGEALQFADDSFDVVYAHGVLQYTADTGKMVSEIHRVLRPGGEAILMVYNRISWLNLMRKVTKVPLEHEDAPVLKKFSIAEFKQLLKPFKRYTIIPERFPVRTKLHSGLKARLFNDVFVGTFNRMPRAWVRPFGWHLM
ncbi:MAG TPA: class I SAM-dependent methyltransferase, partial [Anaerolineales bacterium]|nr:class I SAM-dependent methyltransferase [Anaerolineales bacterium]